jgi:hypothetical protein
MLTAAQNHAFAEFVNERMPQAGIRNVIALAEKCGVQCTTAFRRIVRGDARAAPKNVMKIAMALGVESEVLFKLQRTPPRHMIEGPKSRQIDMETHSQVTLPKPPSFSMTSAGDSMHIKLDATMPFDQAFKLLDVLRAIGMFTTEIHVN